MPNRIIKESICTSDSVNSLSWFEETMFYRLIVNCDDYGRFDARPAVIKARLFPLKERLTTKDVSAALRNLADAGIVKTYVCEGKPYLYLPTWEAHQNVRAKRSKYPSPEDADQSPDNNMKSSASTCMQMYADVPVIQSLSESESLSKSLSISESEVNINTQTENKKIVSQNDVVKVFNSVCVSLPKVKRLTDSRKKAISGLIKRHTTAEIREVFEKTQASDFLTGKNDTGWSASFDWLIQEKNFVRVLEGNYDTKPKLHDQNCAGTKKPNYGNVVSNPYLDELRRMEREGECDDDDKNGSAEDLFGFA